MVIQISTFGKVFFEPKRPLKTEFILELEFFHLTNPHFSKKHQEGNLAFKVFLETSTFYGIFVSLSLFSKETKSPPKQKKTTLGPENPPNTKITTNALSQIFSTPAGPPARASVAARPVGLVAWVVHWDTRHCDRRSTVPSPTCAQA